MSPNRAPAAWVLHPPDQVLSLRHGLSWLLLALGAGAVNAGAFLASERFVTHVTGTVTRVGLDADQLGLTLEYGMVVVAFIAGAMLSVLLVQARTRQGRRPVPEVALSAVVGVLVATSVAGRLGGFGPLGGTAEEPADFALLCTLALAMGLMNATVASSTSLSVRTTHMTGPATDLGVHLATAWLASGEERAHALRLAALRGGKLLAFIVGAMTMVPTVARFGYGAFAFPAGLVALATARSFWPSRVVPFHPVTESQ